MEDEAQHNIEEEKRKSRILTDVSTFRELSGPGIDGSLGPPTARSALVQKKKITGSVRSEVSILVAGSD